MRMIYMIEIHYPNLSSKNVVRIRRNQRDHAYLVSPCSWHRMAKYAQGKIVRLANKDGSYHLIKQWIVREQFDKGVS